MRGIPDAETVNKKKCILRFQMDIFRKYNLVQLLISPIPGILTTFFIIFIIGRLVTSTMSPGKNQRVLSEMTPDSKSGNSGGAAPW
jgi:hypothetical protein